MVARPPRPSSWLRSVFTFALTFPLNKLVGRDFIPADDQSELRCYFDTPVGTSGGHGRIVRRLAAKMVKIRGVEFVNPFIQPPPGGRPNHSHIYVRLVDASKRKYSNLDVADDLRKVLYRFQ